MKIKPIEVVASMSGKVCQHSDMYFRTNKITGKVSTGKVCYPSTKAPSADQLAARQEFKTTVQAINAWLADPSNATERNKLYTEFKSQHKIGSFFGYVFSQYKKGNVTL